LAHKKSASKRIHITERRRLRNRLHLTRARTFDKRARAALGSSDVEASEEAVREAVRWLDHAASKGVIHPNKASRRKSRLMRQLAHKQTEAQ
jgi:small subunit ribosomal protein S20